MSTDTREALAALPPLPRLGPVHTEASGKVERWPEQYKSELLEWWKKGARAALATQPAQPSAPGEFAGWQQRYIDPEEGPSSWQACSEDDARLLRSRTDYDLRRTYAAQPSAQGEAVAQKKKWTDGEIKALYVQRFGEAGWLDAPGSWFIEGVKAGYASAPAAPAQDMPSSCGLTECKNKLKCDRCKTWDSMGI